jgi:hypothetical protein
MDAALYYHCGQCSWSGRICPDHEHAWRELEKLLDQAEADSRRGDELATAGEFFTAEEYWHSSAVKMGQAARLCVAARIQDARIAEWAIRASEREAGLRP